MLILPYNADLRLSQLPYATMFIFLLCILVYIEQEENRERVSKAITEYCKDIQTKETDNDKFDYMPGDIEACKYFISMMHDLPDKENWIEYNLAIFGDKYSIDDLNKYEKYEVLHYEKFKINAPKSLDAQLMYAPYILNPVKMITAAISHASWMHLIGNLIFFFAFTPALELLAGSRLKFLGLMILIAFSSHVSYSIVSIINSSPIPSLGLSGVVMGMIGFSAYMMPHAKIRTLFWFYFIVRIISVPAWLLAVWYIGWDTYDLFSRTDNGGVNLVAHVSGGFSGYLFGMLIFKKQRTSIKEVLGDEIEFMRAKRQDYFGVMSSFKGDNRRIDSQKQEVINLKTIGRKMDLLYKYVMVGNTSEAMLLILEDYELQSASPEIYIELFNEIGKWKKKKTYLCTGRLVINLLYEQKKYGRIFPILESCYSADPEFILADPNTVLFLANMAVENNQNGIAYKLVKNSTTRYQNYINQIDCILLEAKILWVDFDKANEAKNLLIDSILYANNHETKKIKKYLKLVSESVQI